jgi:hypothetical protein
MSKVEFLQMVPALLFGISLAEIALYLGKVSKGNIKLYWEHMVLIAFSFETIIFNWYIFYDRLANIESNYLNFMIQLFSPLASFIYVANLLIENDDASLSPENFFRKNRKKIFLSLSLFVIVNVFTVTYFNPNIHLGLLPIIPISVIILNAYYDFKGFRIFAYTVKLIQIVAVCIYFK